MHYTAPEIVLILGAFGTVIVNIIAALRLTVKVDDIKQRTAVIEGHVNSERTRLNEQSNAQQKEIDMLRQTIAEKDRTASLLAQTLKVKEHHD